MPFVMIIGVSIVHPSWVSSGRSMSYLSSSFITVAWGKSIVAIVNSKICTLMCQMVTSKST